VFRVKASKAIETKLKLPDDARLGEVSEIINDGDLQWNATVKYWVAVAPQGEERVAPGQHGLYSRKNGA
jgi:hypothetical protein